ncbi:MAG: alpha/beta fold hydrolase [Yoonia sp.]|nr:alpha/beta fold hydrolase [Yoonia sp.]
MIPTCITDLERWLAESEAAVPAIRPDCTKSIIWADKRDELTDVAVVFIHGFSATGHEIRPLPDLVANGLVANLFFTRLSGHGQDGPAMGCATLDDWRADVAQALAFGRMLGKRVLVIGCSTGCTLAADALAAGDMADGVVFVSPNFGLTHRLAQFLIDLPLVRHWGHWIAGRERSFGTHSDAHAAYWTMRYPTAAIYTMGDAVRAVRGADLSAITTPAMFAYNEDDQVVSANATRAVMGHWGGSVHEHKLVQTARDDTMGHVMAGDVFSPDQTAPLVDAILRWFTAEVAV